MSRYVFLSLFARVSIVEKMKLEIVLIHEFPVLRIWNDDLVVNSISITPRTCESIAGDSADDDLGTNSVLLTHHDPPPYVL